MVQQLEHTIVNNGRYNQTAIIIEHLIKEEITPNSVLYPVYRLIISVMTSEKEPEISIIKTHECKYDSQTSQ